MRNDEGAKEKFRRFYGRVSEKFHIRANFHIGKNREFGRITVAEKQYRYYHTVSCNIHFS